MLLPMTSLFNRYLLTLSLVLMCGLLLSPWAQAALPNVNVPGGGSSDMQNTIKQLFSQFLILVGLLVCAIAFYIVAGAIVSTFSEIRAGKAEWGKFVAIVIVGVGILVVIIWLCTEAAKIMN